MTHRLPARSRWFATPALAAITVLATALAGGAPAQAASSHGWRVIRIVQPFNTNLLAIAAFRGSPAWVGGGTPAEAPVAYHLVRGTLHPVALPGPTPSFVNSMSATSPTNVWASLSNAPGGPVVRLTKHGWVAHTFPIGTDQILADGVVTLSPKDTWAFNYDVITKTGYAYHYNGLSWHRQALPASVDANSDTGLVSGSSPSNIWALTFVKNRYASLRYNGKKWQVIPFPGSLAPAGTTVFAREILAVARTK